VLNTALAAVLALVSQTPPPPAAAKPTASPILPGPPAYRVVPIQPEPTGSIGYYPGLDSPHSVLELRISSSSTGVMWQDSLRIGGRAGANFEQSKSEADAPTCPIVGYERSSGTRLRVNIQPVGAKEGRAGYNVGVHWDRPNSADGCSGKGKRMVSITQTLELAPGEERILEGDAGLTVRVRRR
jgi:hypothetical protein